MRTTISKSEFKNSLRKQLFWDIDFSNLDVDHARRLIIERVSTEGDINEFSLMIKYYGKEKVADEAKKIGFLDNKTLSYLSYVLNVPKSDFKCYIKHRSKQIHWNS